MVSTIGPIRYARSHVSWGKGNINKKERLDIVIFERGYADTRSKARSVIMAGLVYVDGQKADKPGTRINREAPIEVRESGIKYVSRGGLKLEAALEHFEVDPSGCIALDVGASTGGFTHCLLKYGVAKVYALDVGYGQLDWSLRNDEKVRVMERFNARNLTPDDIGEKVDIATVDVSFISLTKVLPPLALVLKPEGVLIALIKPQFEVGKGEVGKGGIVRDEAKHTEVVDKITKVVTELGFDVKGVIESPILGAEGNKEFLICGTAPI